MAFVLLAPRIAMWALRTPVARRLEARAFSATKNALVKAHMFPKLPNVTRIIPKFHIPQVRLPPGVTHAMHVVKTMEQQASKAAAAAVKGAAAKVVKTGKNLKDKVKHSDSAKKLDSDGNPLVNRVLEVAGPVVLNKLDNHKEPPNGDNGGGEGDGKGNDTQINNVPAPMMLDQNPALSNEPIRVYNQDYSASLPRETHVLNDPFATQDTHLTPMTIGAVVFGGAVLFYFLRQRQSFE